MGIDLNKDAEPEHEYEGTGGPAEIAEAIFLSNCNSGEEGGLNNSVSPGAAFYYCCLSLSREFPQLRALSNEALVGRAFNVFDTNGDNMLTREEFVKGVQELLNPTTPAAAALATRLQEGFVRSVDRRRSMTYSHVKKIAIIGAGVAGLRTSSVCHVASARACGF